MKIIVTGGRLFTNREFAWRCLDDLDYPVTCLVHGDARGADRLARDWAIARGIEHVAHPAPWHEYGPAAGPIRNAEMLRSHLADLSAVVVFPGGTGTADMVRRAARAGVRLIRFD